jgi:hypothetical protein
LAGAIVYNPLGDEFALFVSAERGAATRDAVLF